MIYRETRRLSSQYHDGSLMYPGDYVFTWIRVSPWLPWALASIDPVSAA